MLSAVKEVGRQSPLEPLLEPLYQTALKKPYWSLRRQVYPRTRRSIAGVDVVFSVEEPVDVAYSEFVSEEPIIQDLVAEMTEDDVFYDIGANIGLYSCVISAAFGPKNVVAFEPAPPAYRMLEKNAELNGGPFEHYRVAVADSDSHVEFAVGTSDSRARASSLNLDDSGAEYAVERVRSRRLASLVEDHDLPHPTILKIDVEGAEQAVLDGFGDVVEHVDVVYCEIHHDALEFFGATAADVRSFFDDEGYDVTTIHEREGGNEFVKATRR